MSSGRRTRNQAGFSLLELMMALTVAGILLGIGVPSFTSMIRNNRVVAQTNDVIAALGVARTEAAYRGLPVSFCASANAAQSACAAPTTANWSNGWIIFTDRTGTQGVIDGSDQVIARSPLNAPEMQLTTNNLGLLRFGPHGNLLNAPSATVFVRHQICSESQRRQISLNLAGRPMLQKVACT